LIEVDADLAGMVVPYVAAAVSAYGAAVVEKVRDTAADATADATVSAGRRLLRGFLHRDESRPAVVEAVQELAVDPADTDRVAALRLQLRKALAADPQLATEVATMLRDAPAVAAGPRSVAVQHNAGIVQTGDGSAAWQGRG
jgi:hypothetical protein